MSKNRLPKISDPLKHIKDLSIKPEIKPVENIEMKVENIVNVVEETPVTGEQVFGKSFKKEPGIKEDVIVNESVDIPQPLTLVGKRGPDKKKRKKKIMSEKQLAALALGRERSLVSRRKNAVARKEKKAAKPIPVIAPPALNQALDYSTFSNYMDLYEEKKKKKYSTSTQPHPNKVINERLRPTPPRSAPRIVARAPVAKAKTVLNWTGNISAFSQHKTAKSSRWNYGI